MEELLFTRDVIEAWEGEGGALGGPRECGFTAAGELLDSSFKKMTGTVSQVECAEKIRVRVSAEFDRVARAFHSVADKQTEQDRMDTRVMCIHLQLASTGHPPNPTTRITTGRYA